MQSSDYIESYFNNELPADERIRFEEKIISDKEFAEEVAFYQSVRLAAKEELNAEKKDRFRVIYQNDISNQRPGKLKRIAQRTWIYSATAAALVIVMVGWYLFAKTVHPQQLAAEYMEQNFKTLGVNMTSKEDSLQTAIRLYNDGKWKEAVSQLELIIKSGGIEGNTAIKYAGIVYLELKDYDKALTFFTQLETESTAFSNPAKLYKAITLMARNKSGDADKARKLLEEIVNKDLEGKETAEKWLKEKW